MLQQPPLLDFDTRSCSPFSEGLAKGHVGELVLRELLELVPPPQAVHR